MKIDPALFIRIHDNEMRRLIDLMDFDWPDPSGRKFMSTPSHFGSKVFFDSWKESMDKAWEENVASSLPPHKAGLSLEHNPHKTMYMSVEAYSNLHELDWRTGDSYRLAVDNDELWVLQWYPDTPVGCHEIAAASLTDLIEFAQQYT